MTVTAQDRQNAAAIYGIFDSRRFPDLSLAMGRLMQTGRGLPKEAMIVLVEKQVVPKVVTVARREWADEIDGEITPAARRMAAAMILDAEFDHMYVGTGRLLRAEDYVGVAKSKRRIPNGTPGSVLAMPEDTLGHEVERRINAGIANAVGRR